MSNAQQEFSQRGILSVKLSNATGESFFINYFLGCVAVWLGAILLNSTINRFRLYSENQQSFGMFYILVCSLTPDLLGLSPLLLANICLIIAYENLITTYKGATECTVNIFNVGFFIGLSSFFFFPYIIFLLWAFTSMNIIRSFKIRERFQLLGGVLTLYILLFTYLFLTNNLGQFFEMMMVFGFSFDWVRNIDLRQIIDLAIMAILLIIIIINSGAYSLKQNIGVQKYVNILFWMLIFSTIIFFIIYPFHIDQLLLFAIPVSTFLCLSFLYLKNRQLAEVLHLFLVVVILLWQFNALWFRF